VDLASGEEVELAGTERLIDASLWDLRGSEVRFLTFDSAGMRLLGLDVVTGELSDLGTISGNPGAGLTFDRERKRFLYTRVVRTESDLVLSELR
jgi:hypothetical protein